MIRIPALAVLLASLAWAAAGADQPSPDKVPSRRDFGEIRREVETLRGKAFLHSVPVYTPDNCTTFGVRNHGAESQGCLAHLPGTDQSD